MPEELAWLVRKGDTFLYLTDDPEGRLSITGGSYGNLDVKLSLGGPLVEGKLRGRIRVPVDAGNEAIESAALAEPNVARFVGEQPVSKVIVVPGKLVNIVVKP